MALMPAIICIVDWVFSRTRPPAAIDVGTQTDLVLNRVAAARRPMVLPLTVCDSNFPSSAPLTTTMRR